MKIALVHDYLNQLGGGERVLDALIALFPEADVYTLLYDEQKTQGRYAGQIKGTSFLDFPFARNHHRLFIPLMPFAVRRINLGDRYDLIISDTAGFAKGISYDRTKTKHISYIHTPLRYAWETDQYFSGSVLGRLFAFIFKPAFWYVRRFDYWAGQKPDVLLANSQYIAGKIKQYYGRDAQVIYPPVDATKFYLDPTIPYTLHPQPYYLAVGRLLHYKRFDLIVDAFLELGLPLKIVGSGPEYDALKERVALHVTRYTLEPKIEFLGFIKDDAELRVLYQNAKAFIMANDEDFGLVMAEAQSCGTPVIAYSVGGAREIVSQVGSMKYELRTNPAVIASTRSNPSSVPTGLLFKDQTSPSLIAAVGEFEKLDFDRKVISEQAKRFSMENFRQGILEAVNRLVS